MTYRLLYMSKSVGDLSEVDLARILESARRHNPERGITGVLLFHRGMFLQVLEGGRDDIQALVRTIESDPRNEELDVIYEDEAGQRLFRDWSMSYVPLDDADLEPFSDAEDAVVRPDELLRRVADNPDIVAAFFAKVLNDKVGPDRLGQTLH
jgi:hypothetical protein